MFPLRRTLIHLVFILFSSKRPSSSHLYPSLLRQAVLVGVFYCERLSPNLLADGREEEIDKKELHLLTEDFSAEIASLS